MILLRDYQKKILNDPRIVDILKYISGKLDGQPEFMAPLVVSPTGSGKTAMFAAIAKWCRDHNLRVLILTHRREILEQTVKALFKLGITPGQIIAGRPMTMDLIQVASVQTLQNRLDQIWRPHLILSDEAHHDTVENGRGKILRLYGSTPRIGWSATPARLDGVGMRPLYDTLILGESTKWLVDEGYLSFPMVYQPPGMVTEKYHITRGDADLGEQELTMTKKAIVGDVIGHYKKYLNGAPTIVSCVSIAHARLMAEQYEAAGFRSRVVWGDMKREDREDALTGLGDGRYNIVTFADLIGEGVDIPVVTGIQMLRRTMSLTLDLQYIGRVLRPIYAEGFDLSTREGRRAAIAAGPKPLAIVLDHVGNTTPELHGHPLSHHEWSLDSQKRPKGELAPATTTCPKCYGVWPGRPRACPACGHSFQAADLAKKAEELRVVEGELVEAGLPPDEAEDMAQWLARIMQLPAAQKQAALAKRAMEIMDGKFEHLSAQLGFDMGLPPPKAEDEETRKRKVEALAVAAKYDKRWAARMHELKLRMRARR